MECVQSSRDVLGIDVGKQHLDGVLLPGGEHRQLPNTPAGWEAMRQWGGDQQIELAVVEATGGYEQGVARVLQAAGIGVHVGNPWQLRRWVQGQGQRAKNDRIDAGLLASYGVQQQPKPSRIAPDHERTVAMVRRRRSQLVDQRRSEKTRLKQVAEPLVEASLRVNIASLSTQINALERELRKLIKADAALQVRVRQLKTAPGIGFLTAVQLAVELPELGQGAAKGIAGLVGVAPYPQDSGQFRGRRVITGGRARLRHGLYEATLTTVRCDPTFHAHYQQLLARGKTHKQAMIACLRRLLGILHVMVRDDLTWQQTRVGQGIYGPNRP
jgi:transposase